MKLLIGVPTLDYIHVEFMRCLFDLCDKLRSDGIPFDLQIESGTLVYAARERIAHKAINEKYTHILWLDSDMVFSPSVFEDLLDNGKDYCCGVFHARRKGFASCIFEEIDLKKGVKRVETYPGDTFEIAGSGFGCVLMRTEVPRKICFNEGACFVPEAGLGEDLAFCKRAKRQGFKLFCDPHVVVGHIGHVTIYPEDHERWKATVSNINEV